MPQRQAKEAIANPPDALVALWPGWHPVAGTAAIRAPGLPMWLRGFADRPTADRCERHSSANASASTPPGAWGVIGDRGESAPGRSTSSCGYPGPLASVSTAPQAARGRSPDCWRGSDRTVEAIASRQQALAAAAPLARIGPAPWMRPAAEPAEESQRRWVFSRLQASAAGTLGVAFRSGVRIRAAAFAADARATPPPHPDAAGQR